MNLFNSEKSIFLSNPRHFVCDTFNRSASSRTTKWRFGSIMTLVQSSSNSVSRPECWSPLSLKSTKRIFLNQFWHVHLLCNQHHKLDKPVCEPQQLSCLYKNWKAKYAENVRFLQVMLELFRTNIGKQNYPHLFIKVC